VAVDEGEYIDDSVLNEDERVEELALAEEGVPCFVGVGNQQVEDLVQDLLSEPLPKIGHVADHLQQKLLLGIVVPELVYY